MHQGNDQLDTCIGSQYFKMQDFGEEGGIDIYIYDNDRILLVFLFNPTAIFELDR